MNEPKTEAYSFGYDWAWDNGGTPYRHKDSPFELGTPESKDCYLGYKSAILDIHEHREEMK